MIVDLLFMAIYLVPSETSCTCLPSVVLVGSHASLHGYLLVGCINLPRCRVCFTMNLPFFFIMRFGPHHIIFLHYAIRTTPSHFSSLCNLDRAADRLVS